MMMNVILATMELKSGPVIISMVVLLVSLMSVFLTPLTILYAPKWRWLLPSSSSLRSIVRSNGKSATTRLKTEDQGHLPSGESSCQRCYENWDVHQNLMDECKRALLADRVTFWVTFVAWLILTFWWNEPHEPLLNLMNLMDLLNLFWTS